jgi:hypothetical protein
MHSMAGMMSAGLSSHVSKQLIATAAAESFGDTARPACAILRFPSESTRTANAIHGTDEHFCMQAILPIQGGRGNSQTCRPLVQK